MHFQHHSLWQFTQRYDSPVFRPVDCKELYCRPDIKLVNSTYVQFVCCCCGCRSCYVRRQHESQKEEEAPLENAKKQFHKAVVEFQAVINVIFIRETYEEEWLKGEQLKLKGCRGMD